MKKTIKVLICLSMILMCLTVVVRATTLESLLKEMNTDTIVSTKDQSKRNVVYGEVIVDGSTTVSKEDIKNANNANKTETTVENPYKGPDVAYFQGDKIITETDVELTESVDGNVYIFSENVKIGEDVVILGDLFVFGSNITVEANVANSVFVLGENVTLNGECKDVYMLGQKLKIDENAYIGRDVKVAGENLEIKGIINRDLIAACEKTEIGGGLFTKVVGNVSYSGALDASDEIKNKAVKFETGMEETEKELNEAGNILTGALKTIGNIITISTSVLFIIIMSFVFKNRNEENENYIKSVLIGIAYVVLIPVAILFLIATIIGIPVAMILVLLYIIAMCISTPTAMVAIAQKAFKEPSVIKMVLVASVLTVLFNVVTGVPTLGGILGFLLNSYGFYKLSTIFKAKKEDKKDEPVVTGTVV